MEEYSISLCSVGVMGTKYKRETPASTTVTVEEGSTAFFEIDKIISEYEIGNILNIALRQETGFELDFVTFEEFTSYTIVHLDATTVLAGTYELVLQSFDTNGGVESTLMSDTVTITITACTIPCILVDAVVEEEPVVPTACPVTQIDFDAFALLHADYFQLEVKQGIGN